MIPLPQWLIFLFFRFRVISGMTNINFKKAEFRLKAENSHACRRPPPRAAAAHKMQVSLYTISTIMDALCRNWPGIYTFLLQSRCIIHFIKHFIFSIYNYLMFRPALVVPVIRQWAILMGLTDAQVPRA